MAQQGLAGSLPQFDLIIVDSTWSRANEESRGHILKILNAHIVTGGIICIGYSTMPGCTPLVPVRDLMLQQIDSQAMPDARHIQALEALRFVDKYSTTGSGFFQRYPERVTLWSVLRKHLLIGSKKTG